MIKRIQLYIYHTRNWIASKMGYVKLSQIDKAWAIAERRLVACKSLEVQKTRYNLENIELIKEIEQLREALINEDG